MRLRPPFPADDRRHDHAQPSSCRIRGAMMAQPSPTLLLDGARARSLAGLHRHTGLRGRLAARIVAEATAMAALPLPVRRMEGRRLLGMARMVLRRVLTAGMAWMVTGEAGRRDLALATMRAAADFSDWNPDHFLDTAELTTALAIGLDWFNEALPEADRLRLRAAIRTHGLLPGDAGGWWVDAHHNWNQVCHGGLILGALATYEDDPALAERLMARARAMIPIALAVYAPDGAYPEGPSYWSYGTSYSVLTAAALRSTGRDAGLITDAPGFLASARYAMHTVGSSGQRFTYGDGHPGADDEPEAILGWFAGILGEPALMLREWEVIARFLDTPVRPDGNDLRFLPLALLWAGDPPAATGPIRPARSWRGDGPSAVVLHRSGWDRDATWVGVKAGSAGVNHGHMDAGSLCVDAFGQRWVTDLGMDDYGRLEAAGLPLWEGGEGGGRWTILRHHARAHATITVDGQGHRVAGHAPVLAACMDGDEQTALVDLGPVLGSQAERAIRGVRLTSEAGIVVRDEIRAPAGRVLRSAVVTPAEPEPIGPALIALRQGGVTMWLRLDAPTGAEWRILPLEPDRPEESPNPGIRLLAAEIIADGSDQVIQWSLHRQSPGPWREEPLADW